MEAKFDVAIVGAGIAGIVTALELLPTGKKIALIDRDSAANFGGLAPTSFGGMALIDTPLQRKKNIKDSPALALANWHSFANFGAEDHFPKLWAEYYCHHTISDVYDFLTAMGLSFLPAVNWVERGLYGDGNSVPRYHVLWGTGFGLMRAIIQKLQNHPNYQNISLFHQYNVENIHQNSQGVVTGVSGKNEQDDSEFAIEAAVTVIATGGMTGNIAKVKAHWIKAWGAPPEVILNGTHPYSDGRMHDAVANLGGAVTHLDNMWNYAAGIPHPKPRFEGHGLSLIPCKSALWLNHRGERIGPDPLVTGFDTTYLCQRVAAQQKPYTWQLLNWRIAAKEFAISGAEHNPAIRDKNLLGFARELLLGNHRLIKQMQTESPDFIVADDIGTLVQKMNQRSGDEIDLPIIQNTIRQFDANFERGKAQYNDDQIRRIVHARSWFPDKMRTAKPAKLLDGSPLIAIKLNLISRKSLGGVVTDLDSRVMAGQTPDAKAIGGLYAVGECTGFGGGGASGYRSLEGTFLAGCIMTAKRAAAHIGSL